MPLCDKLVVDDPGNYLWRDTRGLARALTGDFGGAVEDFEAFADWTDDVNKKQNADDGSKL
jgi:hypothetical protein